MEWNGGKGNERKAEKMEGGEVEYNGRVMDIMESNENKGETQ